MKKKQWRDLFEIIVRSLIRVSIHILYLHASPSLQQSSAFLVLSIFLLLEHSPSSSTLQELASNGAIDLSLLILRPSRQY